MTRNQPPNTRICARRLGAVIAIAVGIGALAVGSEAGAKPRTSSEAIADQASRALVALDSWERSQSPTDYVRFVRSRDLTASMTAVEIEIDPEAIGTAWASAPDEKQRVVLNAMTQLGVPYGRFKSDVGVAFDCSGLTIWAFAEAGVELPRVSRDQINDAERVEVEQAEAGDLLYYPGHIGIYLGAEAYVHSPNSGNVVEATRIPGRSLRFGDAVAGDAD